MRKHFAPLAAAVALSLAFMCCVAARPVTTKDLAGNKICWDNGETSTFAADGTYENSRHGSGVWKVTSAGLEIQAGGFGGVFDAQVQPDGAILDATYNVAGKICE